MSETAAQAAALALATGEADVELLAARQVDLRRAVRLGLVGGLVAVFVAAIGMVEEFSQRDVLAELSLGDALMLAIPFVHGAMAGRPPARLQGFAAVRPSWRNPAAGLLTGLLTGLISAAFIVLIVNVDLRETFINITPELAEDEAGPRLLLYGHDLVPGLAQVLALDLAVAVLGSCLFVLGDRWRRSLVAGLLWVVGLALLQPFVAQVLRGVRDKVRLETNQLIDFLYSDRSLRLLAALLFGLLGFGLHAWLTRPGRRPVRARVDQLPDGPRRLVLLGAMAGAALMLGYLPQVLSPGLNHALVRAGIFAVMALGLNLVVGFAGMLDLGYVAFFAVGAYTTAVLTSPTHGYETGWTFWAAVPFVLVTAALAGLVVGTPVLRMRGDYLAIVTLGFGEIARLLLVSDWLRPTFNGAEGIINIPGITIGPLNLSTPRDMLYAVMVLVALGAYVSYALQRSRVGRAWMAMREDESVAEATGVNIVTAKLSAFVMGAILAGLGGALQAANIGSTFPNEFDIIVSIIVLVVVIVGGMASTRGVILGALVLVGLPEMLREFEEFRFLLYGALLIFMMLRRPEGLIPSQRRAHELHEEEVEQDAWLRVKVAENGGAGGVGA